MIRAFRGRIREREPSIMYTIARSLITDSFSFFPWEDHRFVQDVLYGVPLYYNPLVNMVLEKLEYNDKCVYQIEGNSWRVWYPTDHYIEDIDAVNHVLNDHCIELVDVVVKSDNTFNENGMHPDTINNIKASLKNFRKRLSPLNPPRIPKIGMILED